MIKRILVGLGDVAHAKVATQYATELARQFDAELTGIVLIDLERLRHTGPVPIGAGAAAADLREYRTNLADQITDVAVAEFNRQCEASGATFTLVCEEGDPFDRTAAHARYHDLMIFGLKALFEHGVVDEPEHELAKLVGHGVRPILAVPMQHRPIRRVLVAYSGSMESAKTLRRFVQLRIWPDVELRIVTFDGSSGEARQRVDDAARYCRVHGFSPQTEVVDGSPEEGVLQQAEQFDADLIVMGNSGKRMWLRKLLGETALNVIRNSDRALFLCQ